MEIRDGSRCKGLGLAIISLIIFIFGAVFLQRLLSPDFYDKPILTSLLQSTTAAVLLWPEVSGNDSSVRNIKVAISFLPATVLFFFVYLLSEIFFNYSLTILSLATSHMIGGTCVVFAYFFSCLISKENNKTQKGGLPAYIGLSFLGVVLLSTTFPTHPQNNLKPVLPPQIFPPLTYIRKSILDLSKEPPRFEWPKDSWQGLSMGILASAAYALLTIMIKYYPIYYPQGPGLITLSNKSELIPLNKCSNQSQTIDARLLYGLIGYLCILASPPILLAAHYFDIETFQVPPISIFLFIVLNGLLSSTVAGYCYVKCLSYLGAATATALLNLQIPLALVINWFFLDSNEVLVSPRYLSGTLAMTVGVIGVAYCDSS